MKGGEHGAGVCEELRCERMWLGGGGGYRLALGWFVFVLFRH